MSYRIELRDREESFINLEPLQRGGVMPAEARKLVYTYIDGYSTCDYCLGTLHIIKTPPIAQFLKTVAEFLEIDEVIVTHGCREAKYAVIEALTSPGQPIVFDENRHYTTYVAAERRGLRIYEVPNSGYPEFKIEPEKYTEVFERVKAETGLKPALAILTHVDWLYGNLVDAEEVAKVCEDYGIPLLLNTAYSSGRMPISGRRLKVDFITCSGHKSWAAGGGVVGLLAMKAGVEEKVLKPSKLYKVKPQTLLGCTARGASVIALAASFPHVKERVKHWEVEVEKARWFSSKMEELGLKQLGDRPHNHDLTRFEAPIIHKIAEKHERRGYFLYDELYSRGIVGIKPGKTRSFDVSTYGLSREQLSYVVDCFKEIIDKYSS